MCKYLIKDNVVASLWILAAGGSSNGFLNQFRVVCPVLCDSVFALFISAPEVCLFLSLLMHVNEHSSLCSHWADCFSRCGWNSDSNRGEKSSTDEGLCRISSVRRCSHDRDGSLSCSRYRCASFTKLTRDDGLMWFMNTWSERIIQMFSLEALDLCTGRFFTHTETRWWLAATLWICKYTQI